MRIVTPASKLFLDAANSRKISDASASLELRPELKIPAREWQSFSHCHVSDPVFDINLKWEIGVKDRLEQLLESASGTPATLSFHLARDCVGTQTDQDGRYIPAGRLMERNEMISNIADNTQWLRNHYGSEVLIENNNYYNTGAYDIATDPEFISEAIVSTGVGFLFDFAHAVVSAHNLGTNFSQYVEELPLDRVKQIHVSSPRLRKGEMLDSHELPDLDVVRAAVDLVTEKTAQIPAVSIEYYKSVEHLVGFLHILTGEGQTIR